MASPSTGPPGPGPGSAPQSLLDLVDLDARAKRMRGLRQRMLSGFLVAGIGLAGLLIVAALQIAELGPAIRAAHGEGTRGEFTLQQYGCGRFSCTWTGRFVADNGRLTLSNVAFNGHVPSGARQGAAIPGLYSGDPGTIYPVTGSSAWIADVAGLAFEILALILFGGVMVYAIHTQRELARLWRPMTAAEREALQRTQARFRRRVDRRLQRQRDRPALNGRGRHTAH